MGMQVSCRLCPQISSSGNIQRCQSRCRADTGNIVQEKRNRNNRGTVHARPCTYADTNSTEILSVRNNGIFKGEKFAHDIREICEFKVQVREPSFLVSWILWALYIRKTSKRNCFRLGGQPAAPVTIGELSSIYSAIRRNSSAYLNFTLILPPS